MSIDPFLQRTHIAYFSMEIAIHGQEQPMLRRTMLGREIALDPAAVPTLLGFASHLLRTRSHASGEYART
jgi:hypothetical protein